MAAAQNFSRVGQMRASAEKLRYYERTASIARNSKK